MAIDLTGLLDGTTEALCVSASPVNERPRLLLPGSFNPLHAGHRGMAAAAGRRLGMSPGFELSIVNVDKPPLAEEEIRRRLEQFVEVGPVWLTRAPTFREKSRLFPGCCFAVGADTALRIVEARYYGGDADRLAAALDEIRDRQCRFLVIGRMVQERYLCLRDLPIPERHRALFEELPEEEFRLDISSTALRVGLQGTRQDGPAHET